MFKRQKTLLRIVAEASEPPDLDKLLNLAFVVRKGWTVRSFAFYDFVPVAGEPQSFCLRRDSDSLVRDGYLRIDDDRFAVTRAGVVAAGTLPKDAIRRIRQAVLESDAAADDDFGFASEEFNRENAVCTAGYEGLSVDGFLAGLLRNGIRRIVDVRRNPVSRRFGFHKSTLSRLSTEVGISYSHFPELGIDSQSRRSLDSAEDLDRLFGRYERSTLPEQAGLIKGLAKSFDAASSVLMCMEADPCRCHRSRLAKAVAAVEGLRVNHLEILRCQADESVRMC